MRIVPVRRATYARSMASLTRTEAVARAELIAVREYRVDLDLTDTAEGDGFNSTTTVLFSCRRPGEPTLIDCVLTLGWDLVFVQFTRDSPRERIFEFQL